MSDTEKGEPTASTTLGEFARIMDTRIGLARNEECLRWGRAVELLNALMQQPGFEVEELFKRLEALREEAKPRG